MHKAGFRGIRLNLATGGVNDPNVGRQRLPAAVERIEGARLACAAVHQLAHDHRRSRTWSPPLRCPSCSTISAAREAALGTGQPGFADLLSWSKSGKAYVKISGAYRASKLGPDYSGRRAARRRP